jgi:hypothetical protein
LFAGGNAQLAFAERVEILADVVRSDADEFQTTGIAPGQELPDGAQVGGAGVLIADAAEEEFLGGEHGGDARTLGDIGQRERAKGPV